MAIDTFAKRLNVAGYASPGDIDARDRWAIGGRFKPTEWAQGAIVATLGALSAGLVGTDTDPTPAVWTEGDRVRSQMVPLPGDLGLENRYAVAGHFKFAGSSGDDASGAIGATLGGLTASIIGDFNAPPARDGGISATVGGPAVSLVASHFYDLFFDVSWSLSPTFAMSVLPKRDGAIAQTLGGLTASLRGTALPPDSTTGALESALGGLSADFAGTFTPAPARSGRISGDFGQLTASLRGTAVPNDSAQGYLQATVGGLTGGLSGTFAAWSTDGAIEVTLGAVSPAWRGQFIDASAINGQIAASFGGFAASLQGASSAGEVFVSKGKTFTASKVSRTFQVSKRSDTFND